MHIMVNVFILIDRISDMVQELHWVFFSASGRCQNIVLHVNNMLPEVLVPTDLCPPTSGAECQYLAQRSPLVPSVSQ